MLEVLFEDVGLLQGHFLVAHRAHVVIIAVIDVGPIRILQTNFERFPGSLGGVLACYILRALWFVKNTRLPFHAEVLTQLVEPFDDRAVAGEGSKSDLVERLYEAQDFQ